VIKGVRRSALDLTAAVVVAGVGLAVPATASASGQPDAVTVYGMTPERMAAATAAVVALIATAIGGRALARSGGRIGNATGRRGATIALVLGPMGLVIGGVVVATAEGGVGTGNGLAGGVVAMTIGLLGTALGGLALARFRRAS